MRSTGSCTSTATTTSGAAVCSTPSSVCRAARARPTTPDGVRAGLIASITVGHEHTRDIGRERREEACGFVIREGLVGERRRLDDPAGAVGFVHERGALDEHGRVRAAGPPGGVAEAGDERILTAGDAGGRLGRHGRGRLAAGRVRIADMLESPVVSRPKRKAGRDGFSWRSLTKNRLGPFCDP